jgi:hypothetical protein
MSGGSMNYFSSRLLDEATFREHTPQRRAFAAHLVKIAKALHDIEWVDSCDYGQGDENAAIEACLAPGACLAAAIDEARRVQAELTAEIARASTDSGGAEHG